MQTIRKVRPWLVTDKIVDATDLLPVLRIQRLVAQLAGRETLLVCRRSVLSGALSPGRYAPRLRSAEPWRYWSAPLRKSESGRSCPTARPRIWYISSGSPVLVSKWPAQAKDGPGNTGPQLKTGAAAQALNSAMLVLLSVKQTPAPRTHNVPELNENAVAECLYARVNGNQKHRVLLGRERISCRRPWKSIRVAAATLV